jgi:acetyltransferase-like isoleucine patch superfamily enzyme
MTAPNPTPPQAAAYKTKSLASGGAFAAYRRIQYGPASLAYILWAELLALLAGPMPGALGLALRKWLYPTLFKSCGRGVVFGRNLTLRHAKKIALGDGVVLDDNVVLDAKGDTNTGIGIGAGAYIGRNTIVYCKNGDIRIGDRANISSNCQIFSGHSLTIGAGTVVAAFAYILSGGRYDISPGAAPFADQLGLEVRGPTVVGEDNWIGAHAVVLDGVRTGPRCVLGAGAVLAADLPPGTLAVGVPARPKRNLANPPA